MSEEEATKNTRDQTKDAAQRAWEKTIKEYTLGAPGRVFGNVAGVVSETLFPPGHRRMEGETAADYESPEEYAARVGGEGEGEGEGVGPLLAGAAMTGIKPFASARAPVSGGWYGGEYAGPETPSSPHRRQASEKFPHFESEPYPESGRGLTSGDRRALEAAQRRLPVFDPAVPEASVVGQETMQPAKDAAKARLRMNIIGASRMAAEGKEHKYLMKAASDQARAAGMTPAEIQAAQLDGERVAKELRSGKRLRRAWYGDPPRHGELRYRAQTPAEPMGTYHAEPLQSVETEPLRAYDPFAKERIAARRNISFLPTNDPQGTQPRLKGTRGGQMMTPAASQTGPDVLEQMETGERKGKADPRFRGGTVPESTTGGSRSAIAAHLGENFPFARSSPTNVPTHTEWGRGAVGLDGSALTPEAFDEMVKQNRYDYTQRERLPKDLYTRILQQRRQNLTDLGASQAARERSRSLDERPERSRRAQSAQQRLDGPPSYSNTMEELARVEQELAELLAEPKARGEEASKKAGEKTRTYKGTGKPKPGIESLPSRQGMSIAASPADASSPVRAGPTKGWGPTGYSKNISAATEAKARESGRGAKIIPAEGRIAGPHEVWEGPGGERHVGHRATGRPAKIGPGGTAVGALVGVAAGGALIKSLLGRPEGDEIFIEMSRQMGGPLPKGALNKEIMEAFKSSPNEVSRLLQMGIFSPELARELAPGRVRGTKQAAKNAYEKSQRGE